MNQKELFKSIRAKCYDCCGNQTAEIRLCEIKTCSLWVYRMGRSTVEKFKGAMKFQVNQK